MKTTRAFAAAVVMALAFVMVPAHAAQLTAIYKVRGAFSVSPTTCDFPCVPGVTYAGSGSLTRRVGIPPNPVKGTWSFSGVSIPPNPIHPTDPLFVGFGTNGRMTINWSDASTSRVTFPAVLYTKKGFVGVGRVTKGAFLGSLVIWAIPGNPVKPLSTATFA